MNQPAGHTPSPPIPIPQIDIGGAIDLHVHSAPDVYPRALDDIDLLRTAAAAGMRGLLLKSHHTLTADRATIAGTVTGCTTVFGGLVLNRTVGGLNPVAVETAIEFGARQIWLPTIHAAHCMRTAAQIPFIGAEVNRGRQPVHVLDDTGALRPETLAILEIVRDAGNVVLGTGHLGPHESLTVLRAAHDMGLRRLLVTHPLMTFTRFTHAQMKAAVECGAYLEFCYLSCAPKWHDPVPPTTTAAAIGSVGARHCILASDGGQTWNALPPDMLRLFAAGLRDAGISDADRHRMMAHNPARLLGLA